MARRTARQPVVQTRVVAGQLLRLNKSVIPTARQPEFAEADLQRPLTGWPKRSLHVFAIEIVRPTVLSKMRRDAPHLESSAEWMVQGKCGIMIRWVPESYSLYGNSMLLLLCGMGRPQKGIRRLRDILSLDSDATETRQILAFANELAAGDLANKRTLPAGGSISLSKRWISTNCPPLPPREAFHLHFTT